MSPLAGSYLQLVEGQPGGLGLIALRTSTPDRSSPTESNGSHSASQRPSDWAISCTPKSAHAAESGQQPDDTAAEPVTAEDKLADRYGPTTLKPQRNSGRENRGECLNHS